MHILNENMPSDQNYGEQAYAPAQDYPQNQGQQGHGKSCLQGLVYTKLRLTTAEQVLPKDNKLGIVHLRNTARDIVSGVRL